MSSLTVVKKVLDLLDWDHAEYTEIKKKVDELLDSMDNDLEEVQFDESSSTELLYGQLRKLLDSNEIKLLEEDEVEDEVEVEEIEADDNESEDESEDEVDNESEDEDNESEDDDDNDSDSDNEVEEVEEVEVDVKEKVEP